ncbi:aldolase/citrate lyase family protein [soil metagenome]
MKPNDLRQTLKRGELVTGTMVREMRTPAVMQIMAGAGFDFVLLDLEHSVFGMETTADLIRQARAVGLCTIVRVPEIQKHWISRILDAGADGLMIPYVETVEEARRIIDFAKYPPMGRRGLGTQIGHTDYLAGESDSLIETKNRETIIVCQIETPLGVKNIDEITSVAGVDYVIIGPNDLALTMGLAGQITSDAVFAQIQRVIDVCKSKNMPAGIHVGNQKLIERCMQAGMRLIAYSTDVGLLAAAGKQASEQLRNLKK